MTAAALGAPAARRPAVAGAVVDLTLRRIERALRDRARYRYVKPRVLPRADGYKIESPCCSRNVDAAGGVIDIALIMRSQAGAGGAGGGHLTTWQLYGRDHAARRWVWCQESPDLDVLLGALCADTARTFWP